MPSDFPTEDVAQMVLLLSRERLQPFRDLTASDINAIELHQAAVRLNAPQSRRKRLSEPDHHAPDLAFLEASLCRNLPKNALAVDPGSVSQQDMHTGNHSEASRGSPQDTQSPCPS